MPIYKKKCHKQRERAGANRAATREQDKPKIKSTERMRMLQNVTE